MAFITCPACHNVSSEQDAACPRCGRAFARAVDEPNPRTIRSTGGGLWGFLSKPRQASVVVTLLVGLAIFGGLKLFTAYTESQQRSEAERRAEEEVKQALQTPSPTTTFARPAFTFEYPAAWEVDHEDKDYDPDHLFTIDASAGAMAMFWVDDAGPDPADKVAAMVEAHSESMPNAARTDFTRWGSYQGRGAVLRGQMLTGLRATFRVFAFTAGGKTFAVTEYFPDDEEQQLAPGYQTIQNSFRVVR